MVLLESTACGLLGGLVGTGLAALLLFPFAQLIESSLKLPYLMPGAGTVLLLAAGTVLLSALVAALSQRYRRPPPEPRGPGYRPAGGKLT